MTGGVGDVDDREKTIEREKICGRMIDAGQMPQKERATIAMFKLET